ncbi:hypothetical protein WA026_008668 [Henosepilachna vigintioctopunctata]|uniref:Uncharacterized protein n=1 Tax=Henosepilachna vigintioctopunctata TaxID=420089 RepID=A0AAW1V465_9CUCU
MAPRNIFSNGIQYKKRLEIDQVSSRRSNPAFQEDQRYFWKIEKSENGGILKTTRSSRQVVYYKIMVQPRQECELSVRMPPGAHRPGDLARPLVYPVAPRPRRSAHQERGSL